MKEKRKAAEAAHVSNNTKVHNPNECTKQTYEKCCVNLSVENEKTKEFSKDWEVERNGTMVSKVRPYYIIDNDRLTEKDWIVHMLDKGWVDMNTFIPAYFYALKIRGISELRITIDY